MKLERLEQEVMEKFLAGDSTTLRDLRLQVSCLEVVGREFTGVGFYTDFRVDEQLALPNEPSFRLGSIILKTTELQIGAGFLLEVKNGRITQLEGYLYDDAAWPESLTNPELEYLDGREKDLAIIREIEKVRSTRL